MLLSAGSQQVPSRVQNEKFIWKSSNPNVVTVTSNLYTPMVTTYTYNGNTYYRGMLYTFEGDTTSTTVKYNSNWAPGLTTTAKYREPSLVTRDSDKLN